MATRIRPLPTGFATLYAVTGDDGATVIVDGGQPGKARALARAFAGAGVDPGSVTLIVITHGHWDHVACAAALKRLTGAPLAMHATERERLEQGLGVMPPGFTRWGKIFGAVLRVGMPLVRIEPTAVDVAVEDELSLEPYGVAGRVVHTPGHSVGSVSVVLDSGDALVGDLAMNMLPLRFGPGLPIFAEEPGAFRSSVERLRALGVTTVYPAHGPAFPVAVLEREVARL